MKTLKNYIFRYLLMACALVSAFGAFSQSIEIPVSKSKKNPVFSDMPPIAPGPFEPTYESLKTYKCPQWYSDAKFGIWAHWGPQGVAEQGDWYARSMYVQGSENYKYHVEHYGHPSKFGYKDIIQLWKAEKFDPDRLIKLYKAAGAHYFVSMACHHDNFDLWNSKYHRWNAVNMGPHKDIVGLWQAAAIKQGLRFGISEHMAVTYKWFSVSHMADKEGALAGVPYDGTNFDNFDLYGPAPEKVWEPGAELWSEDNMPDTWKKEWYLRVRDVVDTYKPDYVYSDYGNVPFRRDVGWKFLADYYNDNMTQHGGKLEAVYTGKGDNERVYVRDFENSKANDISPEPWQMDKCIGAFFYQRDMNIMPATDVLTLLVDVVSKNGNLLLDIPLKPDGTLNPDEEKLLADLARWMSVNSEAVFGSRPFKTYGENSEKKSDENNERQKYSSNDLRFTVKGDTLYVFTMGLPSNEVIIKSLRKKSPYIKGIIQNVDLLGYPGKLKWEQGKNNMVVRLPKMKTTDLTAVLRITGLKDLKWDGLTYPGSDGSINLGINPAERHGANYDVVPSGNIVHTANWNSPDGYISWKVNVPRPGNYEIIMNSSAGSGSSDVAIEVGVETVTGNFPSTGDWEKFESKTIGKVKIKKAGSTVVKFRANDPKTWKTLNLVSLTLKPTK